MRQIEKIKSDLQAISEPLEMAGYLDGIQVSAGLYCLENYPDEVIFENGKVEAITVYGMCHYLESEVLEK